MRMARPMAQRHVADLLMVTMNSASRTSHSPEIGADMEMLAVFSVTPRIAIVCQ